MNVFDKKEYNKIYYEKNKEKHLNYLTEKIECEICNVSVSRTNLSSHKKSNKHIKNQQKIENEKEAEIKKNTIEHAKTMLDKLYIMDNNGNMSKLIDLLPNS